MTVRIPALRVGLLSLKGAEEADDGEDICLTCRMTFNSRKNPGTHFFRGRVDIMAIARLEGLHQLKNSLVPSGIKPSTFGLVAQKSRYHLYMCNNIGHCRKSNSGLTFCIHLCTWLILTLNMEVASPSKLLDITFENTLPLGTQY
jgi:hypothetical protein